MPIGASAEMVEKFPADPPESIKGYPENRLTFGFRLPAAAFCLREVQVNGQPLNATREHIQRKNSSEPRVIN